MLLGVCEGRLGENQRRERGGEKGRGGERGEEEKRGEEGGRKRERGEGSVYLPSAAG